LNPGQDFFVFLDKDLVGSLELQMNLPDVTTGPLDQAEYHADVMTVSSSTRSC